MSDKTYISISDYSPLKDDNIEICLSIQTAINKGHFSIITVNGDLKNAKPQIFKMYNNEYYSQQYVGVIEYQNNQIVIGSRFDKEDNQFFLQYVFEKAFGLNGSIFKDMKIEGKGEKTWDLLLVVLFVNQLREAFKKGMLRQYRKYEYNDPKVRGKIDVARHVKENMPFVFNGKVAYSTREYTIDNPHNKLILKAYKILDRKYPSLLKNLVQKDEIIKKGIFALEDKFPDIDSVKEKDILKFVNKKITNSVYKNYEPLRNTSILILRKLGVNAFKNNGNRVTGILIDMDKLWETFLYNILFKEMFCLSGNYKQISYDIIKGHRIIQPDYYWRDKKVVFDAKYRNAWEKTVCEIDWNEGVRQDVFQVLSYMLALNCKYGATVFPTQVDNENNKNAILERCMKNDENISNEYCTDRFFFRIPYLIPKCADRQLFRKLIEDNEKEIRGRILKIIE